MKKYGFGVDIGGTTIKMGLFETTGVLLEKWEIPTVTENAGAQILDDIAAAIAAKMAEKNLTTDDVQGVGLDVPGPVTAGGVVNRCVNLGWGVFNVEQALSEKVKMPVKAGNDANVAALGELWQGGAKGYSNAVVLPLGTGVGAGIIVEGKILAGANGAGGEIGHMCVNENETLACNCGGHGCLEQYCSATGVVRLATRGLEKGGKSSLESIPDFTCKDVFDAAKAGDEFAQGVVEEFGRILGTTMAKVCVTVDPEVIVIGGGVSKAGSIVTEVTEKYFQKVAFHACRGTKFALATLGNDAAIYGGCKMIIDG